MLKEVALTLLSFSGLLFGYLLANIAREEVKPGKKYLISINKAISFISGLAFIYFAWKAADITILLTFAIGIILSLVIRKEYFYIGLVFALSLFLGNEALLFFSSITFLYGCVYGILVEKNKIKTVSINLMLFLLPFLLLLIEYLAGRYGQLMAAAGTAILSRYLLIKGPYKLVK